MSRFKTQLDTVLRNLIVIDTETENKLIITQKQSTSHWGSLELLDEEDRLVTFANDIQNDLDTGVLALELFGDSTITFDDNNYPNLSGGVYLRNCHLHNPGLTNVRLQDVIVTNTISLTLSYSTIDEFKWEHTEKLHISHCFINDKYRDIKDRASKTANEWFMNNRVDGEMW
ncbi:hypothetical protein pETSU_271 [Edwardsiella phage pEt-SU]|uniref:Uncharacterized protein n=1 Tax=Edwardsiella phage pEt-SU TaxID=2562142 RepID=A0A4D6DX44_9CAUD|nr:hypothetical protein HOV39_gp251 [Edwardsiella phage pEt-SU]QBZ70852.1 hypothetical protein pETSU_271 [Edwardsiella phage pEt-SU]